MSEEGAVRAIREVWARWAVHQLTDVDAWRDVTAILARIGPASLEGSWPANDDERG